MWEPGDREGVTIRWGARTRGPRTILLRLPRQLVERGAPVIVDKEAEARLEVGAPAAAEEAVVPLEMAVVPLEMAVIPQETAEVRVAQHRTIPWWLSCSC